MKKAYRLKHVPTGLYWVKRSYGRLSDTGTVFTTGANSFNGLDPMSTICLRVTDEKTIRKHMSVFKRVGELREHPETRWVEDVCKVITTGKTYFTWRMTTKVADFEKEYVTLDPEAPESTVNGKESELIEQVTRICWDQMFSVTKSLMPFENLLEHVKNQLNNK